MKKIIMLFFIIILLGCAHTIELSHFETGRILKGEYNKLTQSITIVMPNGEILKGKYIAINDISFKGGSSKGQAYALLKSDRSNLMMEIIVTYSGQTGHGFGEARTNYGRKYKVQF